MAVSDGEIIKVTIECVCPDLVIAQNVYWYRLDDPTPDNPSNSQIVAAVDTALDDMYSAINGKISTQYEFDDYTVDKVEWDGTKWEVTENLGLGGINIVGLNSGDAFPHGVAAVVTGRSTRPQSRGRKFIPGYVESFANDSTWVATVITDLVAYGLEYLLDRTVVSAAQIVPIIASQSGPTAGSTFDLIEALIPLVSGYQRRRKPGVGS